MQCTIHPGVPAAGVCTRCDKTICNACRQERNGKPFCTDCAAFLDRRQGRPAPVGPGVPGTGAAAPPVPQAPPAWDPSGDFGSQPVFADEPAAASVFAPTPAAEPQRTAAPSGVFGGAALAGDAALAGVAQAPGDVYQGPEHVYQGPEPGSEPAAGRAPHATEGGGAMPRAALFGAVAGALAVFIWYEVALSTGREFGILALLAGAMVGFGTRLGAGGGSPGAGRLAAFILLVSMFIGEYMIIKHFVDTYNDSSAMAEEAAIEYDCDFTLDEARQLVGMDEDEWDALKGLEQRSWKRAVETECREDTGEISSDEDVGLVDHEPFSLGQFIAGSLGYFGVMGLVFLVIGAGEAYKIASSDGE